MELKDIIEFKSLPLIKEKLANFGFAKTFAEAEIILNENAYIKIIPIVTTGSIGVSWTLVSSKTINLKLE